MQGFAIVHLQTLLRVTRQRFTSKSRQIVLNHEKKEKKIKRGKRASQT